MILPSWWLLDTTRKGGRKDSLVQIYESSYRSAIFGNPEYLVFAIALVVLDST